MIARAPHPRSARRRAVAGPFVLLLVGAAGCAGGGQGGSSPRVPSAAVPAPGLVCPTAAPSAVVTFPDANLARAIRSTLGVGAEEPLTCELLARVTRLHAPDARIRDLSGIENLVRLEELHIYGNNEIRDVGPLARLTALSDLILARNQIEDLGPLGEIQTLTSLDLYGNPVRDLAPLAHLTGLVRLRLASPHLSDVGPLSALTSLTRLELADNAITDLGPLASLTALTRLSLADNPHLSDLTPLASLTSLDVLDLSGTAAHDLSPLASLTRITSLSLAATRIFDLGPVIGMAQLSRLDLRGNLQLADVQPLLFHATFGEGDAVRLENTGVRCTDVAALQAKGVTVFTTCR